MATIEVRRASAWADFFRAYKIRIGTQKQKLKRNSSVVFSVRPGVVAVAASIDYVRPASWSNSISPGENVVLIVEHGDVLGGMAGGSNYLRFRRIR